VRPSAQENRAWVRQRVREAGMTWEVEMKALALAVFAVQLAALETELEWTT
jgi:hypothetical protein